MLFPSDLTHLNQPNLKTLVCYVPCWTDFPWGFNKQEGKCCHMIATELPDGFVCRFLLFSELKAHQKQYYFERRTKALVKEALRLVKRETKLYMEEKMSDNKNSVDYLFGALMTWEVANRYEDYLNIVRRVQKPDGFNIKSLCNTNEWQLVSRAKEEMEADIQGGCFNDYFQNYSDERLDELKADVKRVIAVCLADMEKRAARAPNPEDFSDIEEYVEEYDRHRKIARLLMNTSNARRDNYVDTDETDSGSDSGSDSDSGESETSDSGKVCEYHYTNRPYFNRQDILFASGNQLGAVGFSREPTRSWNLGYFGRQITQEGLSIFDPDDL